jgi:phasin
MSDSTGGKDKKILPEFGMPKFEIPNFEMPKMEMPAPLRELADKSMSQAKDHFEKLKAATEEATDVLESSYSAAAKGTADYGLALIDVARTNMSAAFDFASELASAKSPSDLLALSTAHARKQFEIASAQAKNLAALAQKLTTEAAEPIKSGVSAAIKKGD